MHTDTHGREFSFPGPYMTLAEVKVRNRTTGHHFFDPDAVAFFASKCYTPIYAGRLFVTSERQPHGSRRFTVRVAHDNGQIGTVGEFEKYATLTAAAKAAEALAAEVPA